MLHFLFLLAVATIVHSHRVFIALYYSHPTSHLQKCAISMQKKSSQQCLNRRINHFLSCCLFAVWFKNLKTAISAEYYIYMTETAARSTSDIFKETSYTWPEKTLKSCFPWIFLDHSWHARNISVSYISAHQNSCFFDERASGDSLLTIETAAGAGMVNTYKYLRRLLTHDGIYLRHFKQF